MSEPAPSNRMPPARPWLPSRKALVAVAIAFAAGLLLFLALWLDMRDNNSFYRTAEAPRSLEGQVFAPLPVPAPADDNGHLENGEDEDARSKPAAFPAAPVAQAPAPAPAAPVAPVPAPASADSVPRLVSSPAPRYPRSAQRRGIEGEVLLRVHVGTDGEPEGIDLVRGSGSRELDRAAVEGVRRWRFAPAMRNGQAVDATVQVPITFDLQ